ncbi:nuclear transport factor 2 family protein [Yinghuangia sp. YIM S09857]|uniref:nuclear transport factor 2 family protein n=1 Tax=Yinghuangia sp. YIM S09857 TaxID=3436929 RepID=UPI003F52A8BD
MVQTKNLTDPVVRSFVEAVNTHNREAFAAVLTPNATMADDGTERDLGEWTDREIFTTRGHIDVVEESDEGRAFVADYRNDTWGSMRTSWRFTVEGNKISRFETGQA